jgi:PAS domain S-box-containing protein
LDNAMDAAYRRNLQQDQYDYMSPVIEQITGWTVEEMTQASLAAMQERICPDDRIWVEQEIERTLADCRTRGRATGEVEYRFLCKDGHYRWIADRIFVLADDTGNPLYRGGIFRDITARKQAEALQQDHTQTLIQLEVLRQVDQLRVELVANVSHELRTPLGLILISATALQLEELHLDAAVQQKFLHNIELSMPKSCWPG